MTKISIAIPTYEYHGKGAEVLEYSFCKMNTQVFRDFDVVISDHSQDNEIMNLCKKWDDRLYIKYFRNTQDIGNPSANTTNAIKLSTGEYIKILCQDDYLYNDYSLFYINLDLYNNNRVWYAHPYFHSNDRKSTYNLHIPYMNPSIMIANTIGTPSCITIKNTNDIPGMDKNLNYAYDCDWYYYLYKKYGNPFIGKDATVINYLWGESISSKITPELIQKENNYILGKHGIY